MIIGSMRFGLPLLLLLATIGDRVLAADSDRLLSHAPSNTCLAIYADNAAAACTAFKASRLGRVLTGPDFKPLIADLDNSNRASALNLKPALGFDWKELSRAEGPATLIAIPLTDRSLGLAFLFSSRAPSDQFPEILNAAEKSFLDRGFTKTASPRNGAKLWVFTPPPARRSEPSRVIFVAGQVCGVATSLAATDAVLNVTDRGSLASDPDFGARPVSESSDKLNPASIRLFARPFEFWELARDYDSKTKPAAKDPVEAAKRLGFTAIKAIAATFDPVATSSREWELHARLLVARPFRKGMRLLSLDPGALPPLPAWLDADFIGAWQFRADFAAAMSGLGNLYDEANQPGPDGEGLFDDVLNGLRDDPEGVRVDLRKDVFQFLGPDAIRVDHEEDWMFSIALRNQPKVLAALTRFYRGDKRVSHERIAGHDLWTVGRGESLFVEGENSSAVSIRAIAVGGDRALLSVSPERLRAALQPDGKAARASDDAPWKQLGADLDNQVDPRTAARGLMRLDRLLEPSYRHAASSRPADEGDPSTMVWRRVLVGSSSNPPNAAIAKLPKFDRLREAFPRSGATVSIVDEGFDIRMIGRPDEALK